VLFITVRRLSLGVAGATLYMPTCPMCVVRCCVSLSVLGAITGGWGHANVAITLDIYSHVLPGMQEQATVVMDDVLKEEETPRE
jgi:hypothetical protein